MSDAERDALMVKIMDAYRAADKARDRWLMQADVLHLDIEKHVEECERLRKEWENRLRTLFYTIRFEINHRTGDTDD